MTALLFCTFTVSFSHLRYLGSKLFVIASCSAYLGHSITQVNNKSWSLLLNISDCIWPTFHQSLFTSENALQKWTQHQVMLYWMLRGNYLQMQVEKWINCSSNTKEQWKSKPKFNLFLKCFVFDPVYKLK